MSSNGKLQHLTRPVCNFPPSSDRCRHHFWIKTSDAAASDLAPKQQSSKFSYYYILQYYCSRWSGLLCCWLYGFNIRLLKVCAALFAADIPVLVVVASSRFSLLISTHAMFAATSSSSRFYYYFHAGTLWNWLHFLSLYPQEECHSSLRASLSLVKPCATEEGETFSPSPRCVVVERADAERRHLTTRRLWRTSWTP